MIRFIIILVFGILSILLCNDVIQSVLINRPDGMFIHPIISIGIAFLSCFWLTCKFIEDWYYL